MLQSCYRPSLILSSLLRTTTAEPLSAGFMMISFLCLRFSSAALSSLVRLSLTIVEPPNSTVEQRDIGHKSSRGSIAAGMVNGLEEE